MNRIKCPKCESFNIDVVDIDGSIEDGRYIEITECLDCNIVFDVEAKLVEIKIK